MKAGGKKKKHRGGVAREEKKSDFPVVQKKTLLEK